MSDLTGPHSTIGANRRHYTPLKTPQKCNMRLTTSYTGNIKVINTVVMSKMLSFSKMKSGTRVTRRHRLLLNVGFMFFASSFANAQISYQPHRGSYRRPTDISPDRGFHSFWGNPNNRENSLLPREYDMDNPNLAHRQPIRHIVHGQSPEGYFPYLRDHLQPRRMQKRILEEPYDKSFIRPSNGMMNFKVTKHMTRNPMRSRSIPLNDARICNQPMYRVQKTDACEMYFKWGENMKKHMDWKPTEGQQTWFTSLGMKPIDTEGKDTIRSRRQSGPGPAKRREYRSLSKDDRNKFHQAVNSLKDTQMDGRSKYDILVSYHQASMAPGAHFGPAFLGFHREFLLR